MTEEKRCYCAVCSEEVSCYMDYIRITWQTGRVADEHFHFCERHMRAARKFVALAILMQTS